MTLVLSSRPASSFRYTNHSWTVNSATSYRVVLDGIKLQTWVDIRTLLEFSRLQRQFLLSCSFRVHRINRDIHPGNCFLPIYDKAEITQLTQIEFATFTCARTSLPLPQPSTLLSSFPRPSIPLSPTFFWFGARPGIRLIGQVSNWSGLSFANCRALAKSYGIPSISKSTFFYAFFVSHQMRTWKYQYRPIFCQVASLLQRLCRNRKMGTIRYNLGWMMRFSNFNGFCVS